MEAKEFDKLLLEWLPEIGENPPSEWSVGYGEEPSYLADLCIDSINNRKISIVEDTSIVDQSRWSVEKSKVISVVVDGFTKFFILYWSEGATENQDCEWTSPTAVEALPEEKTITVYVPK